MTTIIFKPAEDITTYELALATKFMFEAQSPPALSRRGVEKLYEGLPASVSRHFRPIG
ncbi:hypothetical protein [Mesorhizobium sp. WSM4303]|uniref:hypothetical protein n=1 Tax=Mesorhizobium sp. WSM4303 TaxID=2589887 RepID=UPI00163D6A4C|nr:hypothetical protein [Mesorhizobium sp. WSM4303]